MRQSGGVMPDPTGLTGIDRLRQSGPRRKRAGIARAEGYEYWVVNDDLDRAYADLEAIVRAEGCRAGRADLQKILE